MVRSCARQIVNLSLDSVPFVTHRIAEHVLAGLSIRADGNAVFCNEVSEVLCSESNKSLIFGAVIARAEGH